VDICAQRRANACKQLSTGRTSSTLVYLVLLVTNKVPLDKLARGNDTVVVNVHFDKAGVEGILGRLALAQKLLQKRFLFSEKWLATCLQFTCAACVGMIVCCRSIAVHLYSAS
jgi:hypothetical protein